MAIAHQSGTTQSTTATILKNKDKVTKTVKGPVSFEAMRPSEINRAYIRYEKLLMTCNKDHTQKRTPLSTVMVVAKAKRVFAVLEEKAGPNYNIELTVSSE